MMFDSWGTLVSLTKLAVLTGLHAFLDDFAQLQQMSDYFKLVC